MTAKFPDELACRAELDGKPAAGIWLMARLGVTQKNPYSIIFRPTDPMGCAVLNRADVMRRADHIMKSAMMDYRPRRDVFDGDIAIQALASEDIREALDAYRSFAL